jgi:ACR3 family arsenite efflux pump ArsB
LLEYVKVKISVPSEMPIFYAVLVLLYVLRKRADSWMDTAIKKRGGEYFLVGWWFTLLVMFVIQVVTGGRYAVPRRMVETCLLISIPFVVGEFLKAYQTRILKRNEHRTNGQTKRVAFVGK